MMTFCVDFWLGMASSIKTMRFCFMAHWKILYKHLTSAHDRLFNEPKNVTYHMMTFCLDFWLGIASSIKTMRFCFLAHLKVLYEHLISAHDRLFNEQKNVTYHMMTFYLDFWLGIASTIKTKVLFFGSLESPLQALIRDGNFVV